MEKSYKVVFSILHYVTSEKTIKCIDTITENLAYDDYLIYVVDNCSPNGSGKELQEKYSDNDKVTVFINTENEGFSAGNNIGYKWAKENGADFIVLLNNDVEILQKDFMDKIIKCYEEHKSYVIGPDILSVDNTHQSPQRSAPITKKQTFMWLTKRFIYTNYLRTLKLFRIRKDTFLTKAYNKNELNRKNSYNYESYQEDVELQGSGLIFTPLWIECNDIAFEPLTFMYGEEMLLSLKCARNGWKMSYTPEAQLIHDEHFTIKRQTADKLENDIRFSQKQVVAARAVLKHGFKK